MLDKCYKNIYILILEFIPIDFHPVLRLVNKKFNNLISNKVCRLNRILPYTKISLLKFIRRQPNVRNFSVGRKSSPYTMKSMLEAGLYGRIDIMTWMKQNSDMWKYKQHNIDIESILMLYNDETLSFVINNLFICNRDCCNFLLEHGHPKQIKTFIDHQLKSGIMLKNDEKCCLKSLAFLTGDMNYVKRCETADDRIDWHMMSGAVKSLSIEIIDKYVERTISRELWLVALETNCMEVINHIWETREIEDMHEKYYFRRELSETTLNFLLSIHHKFNHASIYNTVVHLPNYRECFEKIYQNGCYPAEYNYNKVFGSKFAIDQIKWLLQHDVTIFGYDGNLGKDIASVKDDLDCNIENSYESVEYYDQLFEVGTFNTFTFWHQLYYPKYVYEDGSTFIDHILVNGIKHHRVDIVDYLLKQGYDLDKNYLSIGLKYSTFEMCQCLINNGFGLNPESGVSDVLGYCMKKTLARPHRFTKYHDFFVADEDRSKWMSCW